ncbi:MAG: glycosyltransferase family 4 protein [Candidatus Paceibacterota bacterium]
MKKVLIFSLAYYPSHVSGAEAAVYEITSCIKPEEIEFHLVTLLFDKDSPRQEKIGNIMVHRIGFGGKYLSKILFVVFAAFKARKLHTTHHFDALWCLMTYMIVPAVLSQWCGVKIPHIITLQDGDSYEKVFKRWFIRPITPVLDYGFKTATVVHAISQHLAQWPRKRGFKGPIEIIHNGANPVDFKDDIFTEEELQNAKEKVGKQEGDIFLVNTARLVPQKAFDITIRALTLLPEHIKFLIVGGGPDEEKLKNLSSQEGVAHRVIFTGSVQRSEVTIYRRISDIFVMPSRSEGLGNAGLSAMASRLPFVGTKSGGLAEYVIGEGEERDGYSQTAWVVDVDSPQEIARAVKDIIAHPEKVKQVTETAREMVEENYHWDAIAEDMQKKVFSYIE